MPGPQKHQNNNPGAKKIIRKFIGSLINIHQRVFFNSSIMIVGKAESDPIESSISNILYFRLLLYWIMMQEAKIQILLSEVEEPG